MIPVKKDYHKPPAILLKENCKEKIRQAVIGEKGDIDTTYYKHPHVRKILEEDIYHGKCCYCESEIDHAATLQVEHYRPKKGLNPEKEMKGGKIKGGFTDNEDFGKDDPQTLNNNILEYQLILQENGNFSARPSNPEEAL